MASLDRECYVLPNIPQWRAAPHSPIKQIYIHNNIHLLHPLLLIYLGIFATEGVIYLVFNIVEGALTVLLFT